MKEQKDKPFLRGIRSKVIAAFLLACIAILLALSITYYSFEGLLVTVDNLTTPNQKLKTLNNLFQQITELDQRQRADAIRNPQKTYSEFLTESKALVHTLDTLRALPWESEQQLNRLNAMEAILHKRDKLFLSYLKLKSEFVYNKKFSHRLDSLSQIIARNNSGGDTTITTTQKRTTTTTYLPKDEEDERSFLNRLFGKKKNSQSLDTHIEVQEELSVMVDTVAVAWQDSAIAEVGRIMKSLEQGQRLQNQQMLKRELELIATNTVLIGQLLTTLRDVEKEERTAQEANTEKAVALVSTSIKRMGGIMLIFFLGAALLVFLILIDITRSNQLRKQLIQAKEEAEHLSQVKQRFLANMSHEIRTPLQSIIGFAEQLKTSGSTDPASLEAIHNSSEHLLHIVNEVLDYSRLESGKLTLEREIFHLENVIREVDASMRILAERKHLTFTTEVNASARTTLIGDPFRLRQVLYNLLNNAIKFTDAGEVKLHVETEDSGHSVRCRFAIADTGIGMSQEDIDRVFQLFEQVHTQNRHQGGAGLGLTIVKKLIEGQCGSLHVKSEPGKGSTFTVEICYDKAAAETKEIPHEHLLPKGKYDGKVIVVDDDPLILRLCSLILKKYQIDHAVFSDPAKVLEERPDSVRFVFLDIRMPTVNGIDLCKALRKRIDPSTKIIALTAHVLPQEKATLMEQGFDYVLSKPFREQELMRLLGMDGSPDAETRDTPINFSVLHGMTMGDEGLLHSVIKQFLEETKEDLRQLRTHIVNKDRGGARENIHRLAGRTGQIGAYSLSYQFRTLEDDLAKGKELSDLEENISGALKESDWLIGKLKSILELKPA